MATVPDNFVPDVKPAATPPRDYQEIQATPDMFGAAIARGVQNLGQGAEKAADFWARTKTDQSLNNAYDQANAVVEHIKSLRGQDAIDAAKAAPQRLQEILDSQHDNLPTIGARVEFDNGIRRFWYGRIQPDISNHVDQQAQDVAYNTAATGYTHAVNLTATAKDDDDFQHNLADAGTARQRMGELRFGKTLDPDFRAELDREGRAGAIAAYVDNQALSNPAAAKATLDKYKDTLGAAYEPAYRKIEPLINKGLEDEWLRQNGIGGPFGATGQPQAQFASVQPGHVNVEPLGDLPPSATGSPYTDALASVIRGGESGNNYAVRFDGGAGTPISDLSHHPNVPVAIPEGWPHAGEKSTAAGAYQFTKETWDDVTKATGVTSFQPADQDKGAGWLMRSRYAQNTGGRDLDKDLAVGRTDLLYDALHPTFQSLTPDKIQALAHQLGADPSAPLAGPYAPPAPNRPPAQGGPPDFNAIKLKAWNELADNPQARSGVIARIGAAESMWRDSTEQTRQALAQNLPEMREAAMAGVQGIPDFPEAAVRQVYPPVMAQRLIDQDAVARHVGQISRSLKYASAEELIKAQSGIDSGQGIYSEMIKPQRNAGAMGPGAAGADPDADTFGYWKLRTAARLQVDKLIAERNVALNDPSKGDPALYMRDAPIVQAAAARIDPKDPETYANYANAMVAAQTKAGTSPDRVHVLDRNTAMKEVADITNPRNDDPQAVLAQKRLSAGTAWPLVYHDLVSIGGLPGQFEGLENLSPMVAKKLSTFLAFGRPGADGKPGQSWREALGEGSKDDVPWSAARINALVTANSRVADLANAWAQSDASPGQVDGRIAGIATLAMGYRLFEKDESPVEHAVNDYYANYQKLPDQPALIDLKDPKTGQLDPARGVNTQANMRAVMDGLDVWKVQPPIYQGDKRLYPSAQDYVNHLRSTPVWKNSKDGQGVVLFDGYNRAVTDRLGIPIEVRFSAPPPSQDAAPTAAQPTMVQ